MIGLKEVVATSFVSAFTTGASGWLAAPFWVLPIIFVLAVAVLMVAVAAYRTRSHQEPEQGNHSEVGSSLVPTPDVEQGGISTNTVTAFHIKLMVIAVAMLVGILGAWYYSPSPRPEFSRSSIEAYAAGSLRGTVTVTMDVAIRNTGNVAASVEAFNIDLKTRDGEVLQGKFFSLKHPAEIGTMEGDPIIVQPSYILTNYPPRLIAPGGILKGAIQAQFPDLRLAEAQSAGTVAVVRFKDSFGNSYKTSRKITGAQGYHPPTHKSAP